MAIGHHTTAATIPNKPVIGVLGLKTTGNELGFAPGSLTQADNCSVPSRGVVMPRRGHSYGTPAFEASLPIDNDPTDAAGSRAQEMWQWGEHLFVNYKDNSNDYALTLFENMLSLAPTYVAVGAYAPPEPTVMRMKFAELSKSVYWTTSNGLYTLDLPTGTARRAGIIHPGEFVFVETAGTGSRLSGNPAAGGAWLAVNKAVGYRAVFGLKDGNKVVKLSEPNGRMVLINPADLPMAIGTVSLVGNVVTVTLGAGQTHDFRVGDVVNVGLAGGDVGNLTTTNRTLLTVTATTFTYADPKANYVNVAIVTYTSGAKSVQVVASIPGGSQVSAGWFVQLYRTDESATAAIDPGDECFQCYERTLTATDISNKYVTITDFTPSSFLGAPLATNAATGDGIANGANRRPPLCRDIARWDGRLFGVKTGDVQRMDFRLLGVGSPAGLQSGDVVCVNCRAFVSGTDFAAYTQGLPSVNIEKTTRAIAYVAGLNCPNVLTRSLYDGISPTGDVQFEQISYTTDFRDGASNVGVATMYAATTRQSAFEDALPLAIIVAAANRATNVVTVNAVAHGLVQGQLFMLAFASSAGVDANFKAGQHTVASVVDADHFTYTDTGTNGALGKTYYVYPETFASDAGLPGLVFTKEGEPEAWPPSFSIGGLPDGAQPLRIHPTPDNGELLVLLENDDTYALSGQFPYTVRRVDGSGYLVAADSLVEHDRALHGLTSKGAAVITSSGISPLVPDVDDDLKQLANDIAMASGGMTSAQPWALSYESDRQYQLWTPDPESGGGEATRAYVYGSRDGEWTLFGEDVERTCGLVFRGLDFAIYGDANSNYLLLERKFFGANLYKSFVEDIFQLAVAQGPTSHLGVDSLPQWFTDIRNAAVNGAFVAHVIISGAQYNAVRDDNTDDNTTFTIVGTVTTTLNQHIRFLGPVETVIAFAMETGGLPGVEKACQEIQLHFGERHFNTLTVNFTNEKDATAAPVTVTDATYAVGSPHLGPTTLRVGVPELMQQSAMLKVSLTVNEPYGYFKLLGYSATNVPGSERTGR